MPSSNMAGCINARGFSTCCATDNNLSLQQSTLQVLRGLPPPALLSTIPLHLLPLLLLQHCHHLRVLPVEFHHIIGWRFSTNGASTVPSGYHRRRCETLRKIPVDVGFHGRVAEGERLPGRGEHNDADLSTAENGELTCFLEETLVVLNIGIYKWYSICYI